jgi:hypothetical protein
MYILSGYSYLSADYGLKIFFVYIRRLQSVVMELSNRTVYDVCTTNCHELPIIYVDHMSRTNFYRLLASFVTKIKELTILFNNKVKFI